MDSQTQYVQNSPNFFNLLIELHENKRLIDLLYKISSDFYDTKYYLNHTKFLLDYALYQHTQFKEYTDPENDSSNLQVDQNENRIDTSGEFEFYLRDDVDKHYRDKYDDTDYRLKAYKTILSNGKYALMVSNTGGAYFVIVQRGSHTLNLTQTSITEMLKCIDIISNICLSREGHPHVVLPDNSKLDMVFHTFLRCVLLDTSIPFPDDFSKSLRHISDSFHFHTQHTDSGVISSVLHALISWHDIFPSQDTESFFYDLTQSFPHKINVIESFYFNNGISPADYTHVEFFFPMNYKPFSLLTSLPELSTDDILSRGADPELYALLRNISRLDYDLKLEIFYQLLEDLKFDVVPMSTLDRYDSSLDRRKVTPRPRFCPIHYSIDHDYELRTCFMKVEGLLIRAREVDRIVNVFGDLNSRFKAADITADFEIISPDNPMITSFLQPDPNNLYRWWSRTPGSMDQNDARRFLAERMSLAAEGIARGY